MGGWCSPVISTNHLGTLKLGKMEGLRPDPLMQGPGPRDLYFKQLASQVTLRLSQSLVNTGYSPRASWLLEW